MKFKDRPKSDQGEGGTNRYLRLKDGDAVKMIPRGEIFEFYSVFGTKGDVPAGTSGAKKKYRMNVVVLEEGKFVMKIFDFNGPLYDQFVEINKFCEENKQDITKTKVRVSRKGAGKSDTTYMALPLTNEPLTAAIIQQIESIDLHDLDPLKKSPPIPRGDLPPDFGDEPMPDSEELPF